MSSVKKNEQNNTESEEYKARLNYGAEKEKQIMNQIRKNRQQKYDSVMKTSMLGFGYNNKMSILIYFNFCLFFFWFGDKKRNIDQGEDWTHALAINSRTP